MSIQPQKVIHIYDDNFRQYLSDTSNNGAEISGRYALTHFGLMTPDGDRDLGQHWLR